MDTIRDMLEQIQDELPKTRLLKLHSDILTEMQTMPSSVRYHHKWGGGMYQHVEEVMKNALEIYDLHPEYYDCTRDDVIIVTYVHDFDKLDRYTYSQDEWKKKKFDQDFDYNPSYIVMNQTARTVQICAEYGLILSDKIINAISFHHGGWAPDLSSVFPTAQSSAMMPLAILIHCADIISSQIQGKVKPSNI